MSNNRKQRPFPSDLSGVALIQWFGDRYREESQDGRPTLIAWLKAQGWLKSKEGVR